MNDIGGIGFALGVSVVIMLMFPLMTTADRTDDISTQLVDAATTELVDGIRTTGVISQESYDNYIQQLGATGNTYDVEIEVQVLDDNPGKKVTEAEYTKVGENYYYSQYTTQVLEQVNSEAGAMYLKQGDIVTVSAQNTNRTIGTMLRDFFYSVTGNNTASVTSRHSGIVTVNGK